jgi:hypothetical protein
MNLVVGNWTMASLSVWLTWACPPLLLCTLFSLPLPWSLVALSRRSRSRRSRFLARDNREDIYIWFPNA